MTGIRFILHLSQSEDKAVGKVRYPVFVLVARRIARDRTHVHSVEKDWAVRRDETPNESKGNGKVRKYWVLVRAVNPDLRGRYGS